MIERALFIENIDSVLVTVDHTGAVRWAAGPTETMRDLMHVWGEPPNLHWYRVSNGKVYSAANGTPKYYADFDGMSWTGGRVDKAAYVRRFVENLRKTQATEESFVWSAPAKP